MSGGTIFVMLLEKFFLSFNVHHSLSLCRLLFQTESTADECNCQNHFLVCWSRDIYTAIF